MPLSTTSTFIRRFPVISTPTEWWTSEDIDLLSREIRRGRYRPQFDLNKDKKVDRLDHEMWVHELKNTWFGDADLNDEFNSNDFVQVFQEGKYETALRAGWAEGDGTPVVLSTAATLSLRSRTVATSRVADGCSGGAGAGRVAVVASGCGLHSTEGYSATIPAPLRRRWRYEPCDVTPIACGF